MKCPVCPDSTLAMSNREGIEIDYCPQCRGVWLDRGELDKIIERTSIESAPAAQSEPARRPPDPRYPESRYGDDDDHRYRDQGGYHKRKRKGLLGDLFDFD
jgi:uncharacterized protein